MHLTLLVPGLLWPGEILRDVTFDLPLPALQRWLSRARITPQANAEEWLAAACGLDAPLPAAALRLRGEGGDPGDARWICLDPLHLRLEEWSVLADASAAQDLSAAEGAALRDAIAPLFADVGELFAVTPARWYLRLHAAADIETLPLTDIVGRPLSPALPGGPRGNEWRRRLAEAQPLLHAHPVNRERALAGRPTIGHLWPWGEGRLPAKVVRPADRVLCNDPLVCGLAQLAGCELAPLPKQLSPQPGHTLVALDALLPFAAARDTHGWRGVLQQLEADWFAPALQNAVPPRLTFLASGHGRALLAEASPWTPLCLWKSSRPLADLLA